MTSRRSSFRNREAIPSRQPVQFARVSLSLFFALYCLEAGLFFTVVPWTPLWTANPLLHRVAAIGAAANDPFVRGFISGIGIVHLILGVRELARIVRARRSEP